jgi:hypothetical protein
MLSAAIEAPRMDDKLLEKFEKIKTLTERGGTEGERKAAVTRLAEMREKYPGIDALLTAKLEKEKAAAEAAAKPQNAWNNPEAKRTQRNPSAGSKAATKGAGKSSKATSREKEGTEPEPEVWWRSETDFADWLNVAENLYKTASDVAHGVGDFASRFSSGVSGLDIAAKSRLNSYQGQNGSFCLNLVVPPEQVQQYKHMTTPIQREAFKRRVLAAIEEHLNSLQSE